jgi:SAM-dependent methyltransferase
VAGFSAAWLALRESADHAARSPELTRTVIDFLPDRARILDLAAGTGSNRRYLAAAGSERADFLLVDHDPLLLAQVPRMAGVETRCLDLSTLDDRDIFDGRHLVTASALLDLVSEPWLRAAANRCAECGAAVLFVLSYDGRIVCSPPDPDDGAIVSLINEHQRTDKGFGPALGPGATERAVRCFGDLGYRVQRAPSDWRLAPESGELQRQLIDGWARAAAEMAPQQIRTIDAWRDRRLAHVAAGWSAITVGHEDFAGLPPGSNRSDH